MTSLTALLATSSVL